MPRIKILRRGGIYTEGVITTDPGWEDQLEFVKAFTETYNIDFQIEEIERKALTILADVGINSWPYTLPDDRVDPILKDARSALLTIKCLEDDLDQHDERNARLNTYILGKIAERMNIRPFEPLALTGKLHKRRSSEGGQARVERIRQTHNRWLERAQELIGRGQTKESAAQIIHREECALYKREKDKYDNGLSMDPPLKPRKTRTISNVIGRLLKPPK